MLLVKVKNNKDNIYNYDTDMDDSICCNFFIYRLFFHLVAWLQFILIQSFSMENVTMDNNQILPWIAIF